MLERLNMKSKRIKERLIELIHEETGESNYKLLINKSIFWKQVFYEFIFEALGFSKNKEPMLKLSKNLKLKDITKILKSNSNDKILTIQALLFGKSGFLNEVKLKSGYPFDIKNLWLNLKNFAISDYQLDPVEWKFFRMRPPNFPTLRIAYGSQIVKKIIEFDLFKQIIQLFSFQNIDLKITERKIKELFIPADDEFWYYNYKLTGTINRFGGKTKPIKLIGKERINDIISNVIIPFVYLYSGVFDDKNIQENVLSFYISHKVSVSNSVSKTIFEQLLKNKEIKVNTSAIEQATIQLYNFYCSREKCDECKVGTGFVREKGYEYRIIFY